MPLPHRMIETPHLIGRSLDDARLEAARRRLRVVVLSGSPGWWTELPHRLRVVAQMPPPHAPIRRRCAVSVDVDGGGSDRAAIPTPGPRPVLSREVDPATETETDSLGLDSPVWPEWRSIPGGWAVFPTCASKPASRPRLPDSKVSPTSRVGRCC